MKALRLQGVKAKKRFLADKRRGKPQIYAEKEPARLAAPAERVYPAIAFNTEYINYRQRCPVQKKGALFRHPFLCLIILISEAEVEADTEYKRIFLVCFGWHQVNASEIMIDLYAVVHVLGV